MAFWNRIHNKLFLIFIFITAFLFVSPVLVVEAHSTLQKTHPQSGESLEKKPSKIELWFEDPVIVHSESIKVTSENGTELQEENPLSMPKTPDISSSFYKTIFNPASIPYISM